MQLIPIALSALAASSLSTDCSNAELVPVTDAKEKSAIERNWISNKSLKLTAYYPAKETLKHAQTIIGVKKIKQVDVSEMLYYSLDEGRHVLFIETGEHGRQARYHCIGFTKEGVPAVYWVQFQKSGEKIRIEAIEKPEAHETEAKQDGQDDGDKPSN